MEIQSILESGKSISTMTEFWKRTAQEFIAEYLRHRKYNKIYIDKYSGCINPKNIPMVCNSDFKVLEIELVNGKVMIIDEAFDGFLAESLSLDDTLAILDLINSVQKCDDTAKDN